MYNTTLILLYYMHLDGLAHQYHTQSIAFLKISLVLDFISFITRFNLGIIYSDNRCIKVWNKEGVLPRIFLVPDIRYRS